VNTQDWRHFARCRDADPNLFFAADQERGSHKTAREDEAKAICRTCPVMEWCGQWALNTRQRFGVWGGLSEDERRSILRRQGRGHGRRYPSTTAA
jgi:WhiB family redox-sensing transcriptional regulator